jgi:HEAT repeat protein
MGGKGLVEELKSVDPLSLFLDKNLPQVTRLLADSDVAVRKRAIDFLENLEELAAPAVPALTGALADPNRFVRWAAARAIGAIGPEKTTTAVPGLAKLLSDPDLTVRIAAANTLFAMGDDAKAAVPALVQGIGEGDVEGRLAAMQALYGMIPGLSKAAIPTLIQLLGNSEPRLRRAAALTLGRMGPVAAPALPALRTALGDDDADVRVNASDAILNIAPPPKL